MLVAEYTCAALSIAISNANFGKADERLFELVVKSNYVF